MSLIVPRPSDAPFLSCDTRGACSRGTVLRRVCGVVELMSAQMQEAVPCGTF